MNPLKHGCMVAFGLIALICMPQIIQAQDCASGACQLPQLQYMQYETGQADYGSHSYSYESYVNHGGVLQRGPVRHILRGVGERRPVRRLLGAVNERKPLRRVASKLPLLRRFCR